MPPVILRLIEPAQRPLAIGLMALMAASALTDTSGAFLEVAERELRLGIRDVQSRSVLPLPVTPSTAPA